MNPIDPSAVRRDVERLLEVYLAVEYFPVRSASGRMVAHESRLTIKKPSVKRAVIPQAVNDYGDPIPSAARRRDVIEVVQGGTTRGASIAAPESGLRLWKSTIATKLARTSIEHRRALTDAAELKTLISTFRRDVRDLNQTLSSPSAAAKIRHVRRKVEDLRDICSGMAEIFAERRLKITRSRLYGEALILFWLAITETPEIRAYCLREAHDA